ncbi:glutamate--cysteine ligase [Enterovibrio norvegicus]|uniref:Glutamate--cysteine ligase n=1 Tax=Enterovibrio norvegicus DSM 15893 TaxID=1121869 RepID=A0A1I5J9U4_9GAMM|nr:glutamate--cysteine ligase [Enterovibrio norvegicus]SFO69527.1 glutamate-cysteine ligase [Enterovibrio norvegicus DSM 15893]
MKLNHDLVGTLGGIRRGIEKETLRTTKRGTLAQTPHPKSLGAALTHPFITTDFAEAQLELITPAFTDKLKMFEHLASLHHFVATELPQGETLWAGSLPPVLPNDDDITIAQYGTSNAAQMKMKYRRGLANRYGKRMQTISGIHYNFSFPEVFWQQLHAHENSEQTLSDFISEKYFHMIRNVIRHGWIIPFLFGASPAVDKSYVLGREHHLEAMGDDTLYLPWATSLRLSNLGYTNSEQSNYPLNYDSKMAYLKGVSDLLAMTSDKYRHLDASQQLNASVLQLENELYSSVRPKVVSAELRPLDAMCQHGVEYVELRTVDNNPYLPLGINDMQSHFLDVFLTHCAVSSSPSLTPQEFAIIQQRVEQVATQGRKPDVLLPTLEGEQRLADMGQTLLASMKEVAALFDTAFNTQAYSLSVSLERQKFADTSLTPSAMLLADMRATGLGYRALVQRLSDGHMLTHTAHSVSDDTRAELQQWVAKSLRDQETLERADDVPFDAFLRRKTAMTCDC